MRSNIFMLVLFGMLPISAVYASGDKSEGVSTTHNTAHPPHDHPNHDHLKKLDEGMNRRRKNNVAK